MSKFNPVDQLSKHGWRDGEGLGRNEDGIKEAIKVKLKFDQAGVGHDQAEQFTYHWWDHAFNKASSNINVENGDNGVSVSVVEAGACQVSAKRGAVDKKDTKSMLYGRFVKAATLTNGIEEKSSTSTDEDSSSSDDEDVGTASKLTDEQLMKVCGGRTAHKGARHGLGLSGKLARIAQQEQLVTESNSRTGSPKETADSGSGQEEQEREQKKKKKKKKKKSIDSELPEKHDTLRDNEQEMKTPSSDDEELKKPKSKKKKRKDHHLDDESVEDCDSRQEREKKKKKKKKKSEKENVDADSKTGKKRPLQDSNDDVENEEHVSKKHKKSKKKKKRNSGE